MTHFIVPDIHGSLPTLRYLLEKEKVIDSEGKRIDSDVVVVQLGDLANSVRDSVAGDIECLEKREEWIDVYLLGNHETCHFPNQPKFNGFYPDPDVSALIYHSGTQVAYAIGDILLTHAGVTNNFDGLNALEYANMLNALWKSDPTSHIFTDIGYGRGGHYPTGGIFWSDVSEAKDTDNFRQIFGHTASQGSLVSHAKGLWHCLDTYSPARIAGAWIVSWYPTVEIVGPYQVPDLNSPGEGFRRGGYLG